MKKIILPVAAILLAACGNSTSDKTQTTTATEKTTAAPASDSEWKKMDLNEFKIPFSISVPGGATAKKGEINTDAVEVDLHSEPMCVYTIQKETLGGDPVKTVKEAVNLHKETYNGFKDMKILKQDDNGYTFSYTPMPGITAYKFYYAKEAGGFVYAIEPINDFTGTEAQINKMYEGLK